MNRFLDMAHTPLIENFHIESTVTSKFLHIIIIF